MLLVRMVLKAIVQTVTLKFKSSRTQMVFEIGVKNFTTEQKTMCWNLFLIKLKKRSEHRCFPVNIAKFLRTASFIENLRWLLSFIVTVQYWGHLLVTFSY